MKTIKVFLSGVAVYLGVASINACSGSDSLPPWASSTSSGVTVGGAGGAPMISTSSAMGAGGKASGGGGAGGLMNPIPDAEANESGSRIKVQRIRGEDGSSQFTGFYDSQRKEACYYYTMADGNSHCVPLGSAGFAVGVYYSDAACATDLAYAYIAACPPKATYGYKVAPSPTCSAAGHYSLFLLGPAVVPPTVYVKSGASCISSAPPVNAELRLVGAEVPPSAFVAGTLTTDP